jgi:transcription elongation factor SPT6
VCANVRAQAFGSPPQAIGRDFLHGRRRHFVDDPPNQPQDYAEAWVNPSLPQFASVDIVLEGMCDRRVPKCIPLTFRTAAKYLVIYEIANQAPLKKAIRRAYRDHGLLSVVPTEQGIAKIDQLNPAYVRIRLSSVTKST